MNSPVTTLISTSKGFGMTQTTHEDRDNQESYCNFCGMCTVFLATVLCHDCDVEDLSWSYFWGFLCFFYTFMIFEFCFSPDSLAFSLIIGCSIRVSGFMVTVVSLLDIEFMLKCSSMKCCGS